MSLDVKVTLCDLQLPLIINIIKYLIDWFNRFKLNVLERIKLTFRSHIVFSG